MNNATTTTTPADRALTTSPNVPASASPELAEWCDLVTLYPSPEDRVKLGLPDDAPVRDSGEDPTCFAERLAEWCDLEKLRGQALAGARRPRRCDPDGSPDFESSGAWMPVKVFITWESAGVDPTSFLECCSCAVCDEMQSAGHGGVEDGDESASGYCYACETAGCSGAGHCRVGEDRP